METQNTTHAFHIDIRLFSQTHIMREPKRIDNSNSIYTIIFRRLYMNPHSCACGLSCSSVL